MSRFIELTENHRTHDKFMRERLWTPGPYMAPGQMPDAVADEALRLGRARLIERPAKQEAAVVEPVKPFRRKYTRRSKGSAPENKAHLEGPTLHRSGNGTVADE